MNWNAWRKPEILGGSFGQEYSPTRQQVEVATIAYKLFKDGQANGLTILDGKVVKDSSLNQLKTKLGNIKVTHKILGLALFSTAIVFIQAAMGLFQLSRISASQAISQVQTLTFAGVALAIILLIWMATLVSRSITQPLKKSIHAFWQIAKGNYGSAIDASGNDELSKVLQALKKMQTLLSVNENTLKETAIQTKEQAALYEGQLAAIAKSTGVIEFSMDGRVIAANDIFLNVLGYSRKEAIGQHHSAFVDPIYRTGAENIVFWEKLNRGEAATGEYKRIDKNGKEVWLQASYNPIMDMNGKPFKVVKYATDITQAKLAAADNAGQLEAIGKIQGVIEFDLTGKISAVNDNFAAVTGYSKNEIIGNHHSMFVAANYKSSHEYKAFWDKLGNGIADAGQYKRIGKGGKEVWLQASYNPIMDMNGKPFKVVKYATDITEQYKSAAILANAVEETQAIIEESKSGDLSSRVPLEGKTGAIASLCDGVNALMDKMTEVIVQVREAGETINTAANEISSGNNDLSSRTEQQASSLEETAASMEELAAAVKNNAENAKQANQLAARAGEQGRGFAVVAGEVRNLAQRSATAAKEIKELITDSVKKTADGTRLVENAGTTMQEIVSSVKRVTDIMAEITAASSEQSTGIDQVNQAVTSMDEVTQQNAALVEEAAAAAESLVEQASNLMETVSAFKLAGGLASHGQVSVKTNVTTNNRRSSSSPMRMQSSSAKTLISKSIAKTGTDDEAWEEF